LSHFARRVVTASLLLLAAILPVPASASAAPPVCITPDFGTFEDHAVTIEVCSDPDGDPLTYTLAAGHGTLSTPVGNEFKYTPAKDYNGPDTISVTASDGVNAPVTVTVNVAVSPVNDEPICDPVPDTVTPEDTSVKIPLACTDVDGDTLTYTATALHGTMTGLVYHPESDYNGPDTVTLTVSDGEFTEPAVAQLTVTPVNDLPVCAPASATTAEEQSVTVTLDCADIESADLLYAGVSARHGSVSGSARTCTYTPDRDFFGTDTISFTASDGTGPPVPSSVTVTVTGVEDAPVAVGDSVSTTAGTPVVGHVLANDTDADGDALTAELASGPGHGTLTLRPGGDFTYVPSAGFSGTDTFSYRAHDASRASAPAAVVITVAAGAAPAPTVQPLAQPLVLSGLKAAKKGKALTFKLSAPAKVTLKLLRGRKVVKTIRVNGKTGTNTVKLKLKRRTYTVQLSSAGAKPVSKKLKLGA